jgi:hypothetical protein
MQKIKSTGLALIGIGLALGCASSNTAPGSAPSETSRIVGQGGLQNISTGAAPIAGESAIAAPLAKVWAAVTASYDSLGIPPTTVDAAEHRFGNRGLQIRRQLAGVPLSRYIDCGSAQARPSADFYDVNLSVLTQLTAIDSANTKVVTTVDAMARPVSFTGEYIRCATTGALEARISRLLEATTR